MNSSILRSSTMSQAARICVRRAMVAKSADFATPLRHFASLRPSLTTAAAFHPPPTVPPPPPASCRLRLFSSSTDALVDILAREHAEEVENETTMMPDDLKVLKELLLKLEWKIVESNTALTKLYKTVGAMKVQVSFHCQDATERMGDEAPEQEEQVDQGGVEEEEETEEAPSVRFTVTATKAGKSLVMICISEDAVARIQNANVTDTDVETIHNSGIDTNNYQGPEFTELAEDLQDAFHGFLEEEVGVNSDMAAFITMYFDYKEQCQYVKFLDDAKSIIS